MSDSHDELGRPWRWGTPNSFADAEALSRRWSEGDIISEYERWQRWKAAIIEAVHRQIARGSYDQLNEMRAWMVERGMTTYEAEADPKLLQQTVCEHICLMDVKARGLKGTDADGPYWECMSECAPVQYPETKDPADPLYPHSDDPLPEEYTTAFSLPPERKKS